MESIEEYRVAIRKIDDYCDYLVKRGRKTNSIETMRYMLIGSIRRMSDKDQHTDPTKIGREEILTMLDCDLSPTTKKTYVAVLRSWIRYNGNNVVDDMGLLWDDNAQVNVKWINEAEFKIAITMARNPTEEMIMLLGARCGLRRHEMVVLKTTDIRDGMMTVHGKGHGTDGKVRVIPLSEKMIKKISEYNLYREECKIQRNQQEIQDRLHAAFVEKTVRNDGSIMHGPVCRSDIDGAHEHIDYRTLRQERTFCFDVCDGNDLGENLRFYISRIISR